jgi:hypothetical protein
MEISISDTITDSNDDRLWRLVHSGESAHELPKECFATGLAIEGGDSAEFMVVAISPSENLKVRRCCDGGLLGMSGTFVDGFGNIPIKEDPLAVKDD